MNHILKHLLFSVVLLTVMHPYDLRCYQTGDPTKYEELYNEFVNMHPDPAKGMVVNNLTITRDAGTFTLEQGQLFLCTQVGGFSCAAVFYGKGSFAFTPPTTIEQDQLYRYYERKTLQEPFTFLLMIFADSTLRELYHKGSFKVLDPPKHRDDKIEHCFKFMGDPDSKNIDPEIMKTFLDFQSNGLFYTHMETLDKGPLMFEIDPNDDEEVSLSREAKDTRMGHLWREVLCKFHLRNCYVSGDIDHVGKRDWVTVHHYSINANIKSNIDFSAIASIELQSLRQDQQWIFFYLYYELVVDSVVLNNGGRAIFFKGKDNPFVWINCDPPLSIEKRFFKIYYHGSIMRKDENLAWIEIKSPDDWYPKSYGRRKATYDLTFSTPTRFKFVSVGDNVGVSTTGDVTTSHWIVKKPARNASFNIGYFEDLQLKDDTLPPVTLYFSKESNNIVSRTRNQEEDVATDIKTSIAFYQHMFGQCPIDKLSATEIPYLHGEAFPGLIHLSWATFASLDRQGEEEIFRAHEVAHQWWGIGVDFKSYHDQWLSEGFSDYSGLWYMQTALHDNKKFFNTLKKWKDQILSNRKFLFGSGQQAGPIWLGYRTQSSTTSGDYDLIIYEKGAWVLHMLRNMLIDLQTMNEDKFKNMMHEYYTTFMDSTASTTDFQGVVEKYAGINMGWFFKQWVFDTRIPKYKFAYQVKEAPDGKYKVSCKIQQLDVADDFQMLVPLYVDFGNNKFVRLRVVVKGPLTQVDLPLLPMKPESITFNDLESVLCEVENAGWDDK